MKSIEKNSKNKILKSLSNNLTTLVHSKGLKSEKVNFDTNRQ